MIKKVIKCILPKFAIRIVLAIINRFHLYISDLEEWILIKKQPKLHRKALDKVKKKAVNGEKIKVVFFALVSSVWKYEGVYRLLEKDDRFAPIIVVCPVVNYGRENMLSEMDKTYKFFESKGHRVIRAYNEDTDEYLDVKKEINPDIVFYTNPYKGLIDDRYYITKFQDTLTCYVRYFFQSISVDEDADDYIFHNRIWRFFCETEFHRKQNIIKYPDKTERYIFTGYPGVDGIHSICDEKVRRKKTLPKRIIWAPHHTIDSNNSLYLSNFLKYHQFMIELSKQYSDRTILIFKPHPLLRVKLYNHKDWGVERTDGYYALWDSLPNTELQSNDYVEVFNASDAMIFDCNSFVAEYLYTGKPALFMFTSIKVKSIFNAFGTSCLECYYHGYSESDIENFINTVILDEFDSKEITRRKFFIEKLVPPNGNSPSHNIVDAIKKEIFN